MKRQERKRIAAQATDIWLQQHNIDHPGASRRERRANARLLQKRIVREVPHAQFEKHVIVKPQIIVPEIDVQVEGLEIKGEQRRSESGRIILLS